MKPRAIAAACALAAGLCGWSTLAATTEERDASRETELRRFQWEQALAFMRARGDAVVPRSPYDPMPRLQLPDAKAQFEGAGGKLLVQPTLSTNDQLLEQAIAKTFRMMLTGSTCCPCSAAATCNDGLFCNGAEVCIAANCAYGSPACNDGNPCTIDACTESTDTCSFTPIPPPPVVAGLVLGRTGNPATVAILSWSAVTGASSYNVYRGASSNLGDLTCFQKGVTGTSQYDDGALPTRAFYYLVTSMACSESGLGDGSPTPRPPAPGCP